MNHRTSKLLRAYAGRRSAQGRVYRTLKAAWTLLPHNTRHKTRLMMEKVIAAEAK